jgi:GTP cyclohydrolase IA
VPLDQERIRAATTELLRALGEDVNRVGLAATPDRVANAYAELFSGYDIDPVKVLEPLPGESSHSFIAVTDVEIVSFCEHHLLPFFGTATLGYLPGKDGVICGLSKLSRVLEILSRRLQVQERLVAQAADCVDEALNPSGVIAIMEAEHLCMNLRGARKPGARMVTVETRGIYNDPIERAQVLALLGKS